ncbi:hypothetical protein H6G93_09265 [Nostoc sp. FACHB-973]|nr:hypothetical protein [Nostoc sp. FACHB-973]
MTLFQKLAQIEDKIGKIETYLGVPQRRNLLVRQVETNRNNRVTTTIDTLLQPRPYITSVSPKLANLQVNIEGADSVFLSTDDIQVEVSRTIDKTLFIPTGNIRNSFILEPPVVNNLVVYSNVSTKEIAGAKFYKLIALFDSDPVVWKLILRKEKDVK